MIVIISLVAVVVVVGLVSGCVPCDSTLAT